MPRYLSAVGMLWLIIILMVLTFFGLQHAPGWVIFTHHDDFLVVHTLFEYYSAAIAALIVLVMLQQQNLSKQPSSKALIAAFSLIAVMDVLHALSYPGMPNLITENPLDKAIFFWLIGRSLEVFCFAALLWRIAIPLKLPLLFGLVFAVAVGLLLVGTIYAEQLPVFYIPGQGLQPPKIYLEYAISIANFVLGILLFVRAQHEQSRELQLVAYAAIFLASASWYFASYTNPNDLAMFVGHLLKVTAYTFMYWALYRARIRDPYIKLEASELRYRAAELAARKVAERDYLTGLGSRTALFDTIEKLVSHAGPRQHKYALLLADLDSFKDINDTFGHLTGDLLLKHITVQLEQMREEHHSLYRLGGDEFAIVTPLQDDFENPIQWQARNKAQQFNRAISEPFLYENTQLQVNASIGVVIFSSGESIAAGDLLKQADLALYAAKRQGKNRACFFDETLQQTAERDAHLIQQLRQAIEHNELSLFYQPIIAANGTIVGVEALLRWHTSDGEAISPAEFIPLAERNGLMVAIGDWVLEQSIKQVSVWQQHPVRKNWHIAINISATQMDPQRLPTYVAELLAQHQVNGNKLLFELTETLLQDNIEQSIAVMTAISKLDIAFALDDFGTGYSSLSYLSRLPIKKLKIDQSFVAGLHEPSSQAIIEAILALAKSLQLQVVAEGIETAAQFAFMTSRGCDFCQGFYFSQPLPVDALPETERLG